MTTRKATYNIGDEKKHSVRYEQQATTEAERLCRTLYIDKAVFARQPYPKSLDLTLEWKDA